MTGALPIGSNRLKSISRIESLDYMRGFLAVSVMVYHYSSWLGIDFGADTILGGLGVYAVSTFYILSGLSLSLAYRGRLTGWREHVVYAIKRVFRIFPLFWLTVSMVIGLQVAYCTLHGQPYQPDFWRIFLNYSLLFAFIDSKAYLATGAWSIGNEMVFYVFFPLLLLLAERNQRAFFAALVLIVGIGSYFAFGLLDAKTQLAEQWGIYINPFNQLLLFATGIGIAFSRFVDNINSRKLGLCIFVLSIASFVLVPASGDKIILVSGARRLLFFTICSLAVIGAYTVPYNLGKIEKIMAFLGRSSYSIYLLHPIVGAVVVSITDRVLGLSRTVGYVAAVPITLLVSWVTYRSLERPMMNLANRLSFRLQKQYAAEI